MHTMSVHMLLPNIRAPSPCVFIARLGQTTRVRGQIPHKGAQKGLSNGTFGNGAGCGRGGGGGAAAASNVS